MPVPTVAAEPRGSAAGVSLVVGDQVVGGGGVVGEWFGVDGGGGESPYAVDEFVLDLVAEVVGIDV